jgi:hypothetical protein
MIDLTRLPAFGMPFQSVEVDPGLDWLTDSACALEAPPDGVGEPPAEARWSGRELRTGTGAVVAPRIVRVRERFYRMYYTQLLARPGSPTGALDFASSTGRILSATSADGETWVPEPGVRLSAAAGGAGEFRVIVGDVLPLDAGLRRWRMYYECSDEPRLDATRILSALSEDGGLTWRTEPGVRLGAPHRSFVTPRIMFLPYGGLRLLCGERGRGIISARSVDGGLTFAEEDGIRIASDGPHDSATAYAPEVVGLAGGGYAMYYAGYESPDRAHILRADSADGLEWRKAARPAVSPGGSGLNAAKCSEMCLVALPTAPGERPSYRLLYEACDGTAPRNRGVWRIVSAAPCAPERVPPGDSSPCCSRSASPPDSVPPSVRAARSPGPR